MDSQDAIAKHSRLLSWFEQERERQMENRREMALDCDFYDGLQWNWEDAQVLIERNQSPLVYNLTKPTVDWIIGSERRLRVDWRVLPRDGHDRRERRHQDQGAQVPVRREQDALPEIPRVRGQREGGVGWVEDRRALDPTMESIYSRYESWRYIWFDSFGRAGSKRLALYVPRQDASTPMLAQRSFPTGRTSSSARPTGSALIAPRRTRTFGISASSIRAPRIGCSRRWARPAACGTRT
jgi:hypothetical protein